jgi:Ax21 family sulfation-dependent quorum factor
MKRSLLALAFAAALPMSAQAADLSYSFVELDYVNLDGDADGAGLRGSVGFGETGLYGFGRYTNTRTNDTDIKIDGLEIGLGYHHELTSNSEYLVEAAFQRVKTDVASENGYRVSGGVRGLLTDNIEGLAKLGYRDSKNTDGGFIAALGGQVRFTETWSLNAEIEFDEDGQSYLVGVRASF